MVSIKCWIYKFSKRKIFFSYSESTYTAASSYQFPLQSEMALFKNRYAGHLNKFLDSLKKIDFCNSPEQLLICSSGILQ